MILNYHTFAIYNIHINTILLFDTVELSTIIIKITMQQSCNGNIILKVCTKFQVFNRRKRSLPLYDSQKSCRVTRCSIHLTWLDTAIPQAVQKYPDQTFGLHVWTENLALQHLEAADA